MWVWQAFALLSFPVTPLNLSTVYTTEVYQITFTPGKSREEMKRTERESSLYAVPGSGEFDLTNVHLVICFCITNALKLELLQGLGELLDSYRKICKENSVHQKTAHCKSNLKTKMTYCTHGLVIHYSCRYRLEYLMLLAQII